MDTLHVEKKELKDICIDPDHAEPRFESEVFRAAKERLKADGHYRCWVCGTTDNLQVHHFIVEYMFQPLEDLSRVKEVAEQLDIYGYGRLLKNQPLTSSEDVRCLMVLCQSHHTGVNHEGGNGTGIHDLSFPSFIIQAVCRPGCNPIPQKGETWEQTTERIHSKEIDPEEGKST